MAGEIMGSESKYAGQRAGAASNTGQGAKPASVFGSSIVTPPISGPMQNIVPGSQEWINSRMAQIIEQLKQQYGDAAARRGMLQSGGAEQELEKAIAEQERQVQAEAGQYNADIANREDAQAHESKMAKDAARAQETAGMYSGLGSMAPTLLAGKWGSDTGGDPRFNPGTPATPTSPAGAPTPMIDPVTGVQMKTPVVKAKSPIKSGWDYLTKENPSAGMGALGTGVGTMLSSGKNKTGSILSGLGATGLGQAFGNEGKWSNLAGAGLASSMLSSKTLAKPFSKDNWWKTLVGAGGLGASAGLFGKF